MEYVAAKKIIYKNKNQSWFGSHYNMNIYRGCNQGCIYCDSRSSCYGIKEFHQVRAKKDALGIIKRDLEKLIAIPRNAVIATGAMSDPYNSFEQELKLTRNALELVNAYDLGAAIATKSNLILRDMDILKDIQTHSPLIVKVTITAANDTLSSKIEPNAILSSLRFKTIESLAKQGIYCGILMMPILPFISDNSENIRNILYLAKEHGAKFVFPSFGVTLRDNQRDYFYTKLKDPFFKDFLKENTDFVANYKATYGQKYMCNSPSFKILHSQFIQDCKRYDLLYKMKDIILDYQKGYKNRQMDIFEFL